MFTRDTFRLIKATIKRFITIMLMVFIGAGFMVGLMSSSLVLQESVDAYNDEYDLMDIQIYSSYGFCEEDIEAIASTEGVKAVYASRFIDAYGSIGEGITYVTRIQELDADVNKYELVEGRMPEADDEALVLQGSEMSVEVSIGDIIVVYLDDGDDISDSLVNDTYTIVGIVKAPQYLAKTQETSTFHNLSLNTVIYVPNDNFISEYYTTVYVTIEGAKEELSYSNEYQAIIDEAMASLEITATSKQDYLKEDIIAQAQQDIADAEKTLEEEVAEAEVEIADAQKELASAYEELVDAQTEIDEAWLEYYDGLAQLEDALKEIENARQELIDAQTALQDGIDEIYKELAMSPEEAKSSITSAIEDIDTIIKNLSIFSDYIDVMFNTANQDAIDALSALNDTSTIQSLASILQNHIALNTAILQKAAAISEAATSLEATFTSIGQGDDFNSSAFSQLEDIATSALSNLATLNQAIELLNDSNYTELSVLLTDYFADKLGLSTLSNLVNTNSIIGSMPLSSILSSIGQNDLAAYADSITVSQFIAEPTLLSENIISANSASLIISRDILASYLEDINTLLDAEQELAEGAKSLAEAEKAHNDGLKELEDSYEQLIEAQNEIDEGWIEYYEGLAELEDAQLELEKQVREAEIDIAQARQNIADLPDAEWTLLDRTSNYSHALFEGTVDQMANIGYVFPLLFFLVAALVCLTTMTRLIDEQRNQIGVFSALGFGKQKIISKYLIYACLASLIGAALGIPVGLVIYPVIIYNTWQLMYYLPAMHMPLDFSIITLGTLSFTILMMAVTFFVAWKSLKERPADLLRPKAPKEGKKILLERVTPVWKRLSFITKINARNIFRYKARFFMTVIGVAGCTSLLVLGFGIKDSISDIVEIQYGEIFTYSETISVDEYYSDKLIAQLLEDDNVTVAVSFLEYSGTVYLEDEEVVTIDVFNSDEIQEVITLRERETGEALSISGSGIIISEKFANMHELEVGDTITIESADGIRGDVVIDGICELYFQHYIFMSEEVYTEAFGITPLSDKIAVVSSDVEVLEATYGSLEEVESIVDFTSVVDNFDNMISALDYIVLVIIFAAGSLALVVLINLSEVNISERVREIATFKVLGFYDREVNSYIFKELLFLTVIGSIIGLPLGKIEHTFVMGIIDMDMIMYGDNIATISYAYSFIITLLFALAVLVIMSRSISKVKMVESLKSIE